MYRDVQHTGLYTKHTNEKELASKVQGTRHIFPSVPIQWLHCTYMSNNQAVFQFVSNLELILQLSCSH